MRMVDDITSYTDYPMVRFTFTLKTKKMSI